MYIPQYLHINIVNYTDLLNQACTIGQRPTDFLKNFDHDVGMHVFLSVCPHSRALITSGVIGCNCVIG